MARRSWNPSARAKPHLDLVLTHVDDRFDTGMRDAIGADAARVLPLLDTHNFTFLIEDPATVWHLGPQRYPAIAERYRALTPHRDKLAIDLNIVERYQNVYPTKQQTGTELFQLVHQRRRELSARGAVLREFAAAARPEAAAVRRRCRVPVRETRPEDGDRFRWRASASRGRAARWWTGYPGRSRMTRRCGCPPARTASSRRPRIAGPRVLRLNGDLTRCAIVGDPDHRIHLSIAVARDRDPRPRPVNRSRSTASPSPRLRPALLLPRGQHVVTGQALLRDIDRRLS